MKIEINPLVSYHVNMPAKIFSRIYNDKTKFAHMGGHKVLAFFTFFKI